MKRAKEKQKQERAGEKVTGVKKKKNITRHMTADERLTEELRKRRSERDA